MSLFGPFSATWASVHENLFLFRPVFSNLDSLHKNFFPFRPFSAFYALLRENLFLLAHFQQFMLRYTKTRHFLSPPVTHRAAIFPSRRLRKLFYQDPAKIAIQRRGLKLVFRLEGAEIKRASSRRGKRSRFLPSLLLLSLFDAFCTFYRRPEKILVSKFASGKRFRPCIPPRPELRREYSCGR